jgi:hypothetical protein
MKLHLLKGCSAAAFIIFGAIFGAVGVAAQAPPVNRDAQILADFKARVEQYAKLRDGLDTGRAQLKKTDDPAVIAQAEKALGERIRAARAGAKHGDIFTPEVEAKFRKLMNPQLKGSEGAENKATIKEENPGKLPLKVNAVYPKQEVLTTVPPDILKALPVLPEDLEYRFVGKHMILRDARANLIVDYMLNAIP